MASTQTRQPWTSKQLTQFRGLASKYRQGNLTMTQLCNQLGRTPGAIRQQAMNHNISLKQKTGSGRTGTSFRSVASTQLRNKRTTNRRTASG
jgi:hypothetical protein